MRCDERASSARPCGLFASLHQLLARDSGEPGGGSPSGVSSLRTCAPERTRKGTRVPLGVHPRVPVSNAHCPPRFTSGGRLTLDRRPALVRPALQYGRCRIACSRRSRTGTEGEGERNGGPRDHRRNHHRLEHDLQAAGPARDHLGDGLHPRRPRGGSVGAGAARRLARELPGRADHRGRAGAPALQRRVAPGSAHVAPRARLAEPAPPARVAADPARRRRGRHARVPRHGARLSLPALDDARLDRRGARPEGRLGPLGPCSRASGARRGERVERRPRGTLLPGRARPRQRRAHDGDHVGGPHERAPADRLGVDRRRGRGRPRRAPLRARRTARLGRP